MAQNEATNEVLILAYEGIRAKYAELQLPAIESIPRRDRITIVVELRLALGRCSPGTLEAEKAIQSWLDVWRKLG